MLNWGWIGIVAAALFAGFVGGCEHKQREVDRLLALGEAQEAQTKVTITRNEKIAKGIKDDYETRIAAIRAAYRVRSPSTGLLPSATGATSNLDAAAAYDLLAEQCTESTQQLISLQNFIKETR